ncbi:hypothetical protein [Streptomyces canus]|uniref:hypothetical protein n=1 Tax=Streptomyces canus TaxID=58343 RepID=UPI002DDB2EDF|nr:hypothetical protein [Streptomyces canus]WSD84216.1 hypothetical protein OG925_07890 [Streptomyces canus]
MADPIDVKWSPSHDGISDMLQSIDALGDRLTESASDLFRSPSAQRRISEVLGGCRPVTMAGRSGA